MSYTVRQNESIIDAVLNSTGDVTNWSAILDANFFDSWTPNIYTGQIIETTGNVNNENLSSLTEYPANNYSVSDIFTQIADFFITLESSIPIPSQNILPKIDTNVYYTVRPTETIGDAVLNATGNIENWDLVTQSMFVDTWTPFLYSGQKIPIPSTVTNDLNNYRSLNTYPANNNSVADIYTQIETFFALLNNDPWILATSYWRDIGIWVDDAFWID